jgi:hypothetical protein
MKAKDIILDFISSNKIEMDTYPELMAYYYSN